METFIYILRCPETDEVRYVGKSNDPKHRLKGHLNENKTASSHKINWIQSLVKRGLKPKLEIIEKVDIENWKKREKYWIEYFKETGANLTNYCSGGEGLNFGNQTSFKKGHVPCNKGTGKPYKKTCPICKKVFGVRKSEIKRCHCCSRKCRDKRASQVPNEGSFAKGIIPWNTGKKYSNSKSKNCTPVIQLDKNTLQPINRYPSAAEAGRAVGTSGDNIYNNIVGASKSAGGFVWIKENSQQNNNGK